MRSVTPPKNAPYFGSPAAQSRPAAARTSAPASAPAPDRQRPAPAMASSDAVPLKSARPLGIRVSGWVNAEKAAAGFAPPPARAKVPPAAPSPSSAQPSAVVVPESVVTSASLASALTPDAAVVSPKVAPVVLKMKVVSSDLPPSAEAGPDGSDLEVVSETVEPGISGRFIRADLPPPEIEQTLEIETGSFETGLPELRLATEPPVEPVMTRSAKAYQESIAALPVELPLPPPPSGDAGQMEPINPDLAPLPDLFCPKCRALIPESHYGAFFTPCAKCGEIIKMK